MEKELLLAYARFPRQALQDPDVVLQLEDEITYGRALLGADLLRSNRRQRHGKDITGKVLETSGSTNATIWALKQHLGWGKTDRGLKERPDDEAAVAELARVAAKYRSGESR